jgi:hypothetical protein
MNVSDVHIEKGRKREEGKRGKREKGVRLELFEPFNNSSLTHFLPRGGMIALA